MIASVGPARWKPPKTPKRGMPGNRSAACVRTLIRPACEQAVKTNRPLFAKWTATNRSSTRSSSGVHSPAAPSLCWPGMPFSKDVTREISPLMKTVFDRTDCSLRAMMKSAPFAARTCSLGMSSMGMRRPSLAFTAREANMSGVHVGWHAPATVRQGHHLQRGRHRPRVVPVAVREHHRIDAAHIDAELDDVALEDGLVRARVEQKRVL